MAERSRRTATAATRDVAYRIVRDNTRPASPTVSQERVIRRLFAEGIDREQARRALQLLVATDAISIRDGHVRLVE